MLWEGGMPGGGRAGVYLDQIRCSGCLLTQLVGPLEHLQVGGVALNLGPVPGRPMASTCWEGHGGCRGEDGFKARPGPSWGFPRDLDSKEPTCNTGGPGLIPGLGKSPGEGNGDPFQYSCLESPVDRGAWWATVHEVAKESDTTEVTEHACILALPDHWEKSLNLSEPLFFHL